MVVNYARQMKLGDTVLTHSVQVTLDNVPALETAEFVGDVVTRLDHVFGKPPVRYGEA